MQLFAEYFSILKRYGNRKLNNTFYIIHIYLNIVKKYYLFILGSETIHVRKNFFLINALAIV